MRQDGETYYPETTKEGIRLIRNAKRVYIYCRPMDAYLRVSRTEALAVAKQYYEHDSDWNSNDPIRYDTITGFTYID